MISEKIVIEKLNKQMSSYTSPESAQNQANSLESLSTDIYTDSKRFIYELLQNADDASSSSGKLEIQIQIIEQYLIISHKGEKFTEIDIESICSVGDGNKKGDGNKTGFKGIGFKSVFSHSDYVIINSGSYCFRFDKNYWKDYWGNSWGCKQDWKMERERKEKDTNVKMPWQIIPIWTDLPQELAFINNFNVSVIVRYDNAEKIQKELFELFANTQILLFLRSKEVKITITKAISFTVEKVIQGETIKLKINGQDISEWLLKSFIINIDDFTKNLMENDLRIPKKLRQSSRTEISFAVQVKDGNIKTVDKENRLIFTYLPTSVNHNFPFLVNASFLTDAGRQHFHEDLYWNIWLFQQIPIKLFTWLSELAQSKHKDQILRLVPEKFSFSHSILKSSFNEGFSAAINGIAFIPNKQGDLIKVSDAIWDKTDISKFINEKILIDYINFSTAKHFSEGALIPCLEPINTLKKLGIKFFDVENLEGLLSSKIFQDTHHLNDNFGLILFLYEQSERHFKGEEKNIWDYKLQFTSFIFDENEKLKSPKHIYFPSVEFSDDFEDDISIIHSETMRQIETNHGVKVWLESLGVKEPTDVSFIEKTIIGNERYCTTENAISVGRYLFAAHKKSILTNDHYNGLKKIRILTTKNKLVKAPNAFLANFYAPELMLESICGSDIFVSTKYFVDGDLKSEWKTFFIKIGINENIKLQKIRGDRNSGLVESEYFDLVYAEAKEQATEKNYYPSLVRQDNEVTFQRIAYINLAKNYGFSKLFWKQVFVHVNLDNVSKKGLLEWGYYGSTWEVTNYFNWSLENSEVIPTTIGKCLQGKDVFINQKEIKDIGGKYLPVFDYEGIIPQKWLEYLPFKSSLKLDDYLTILAEISKEDSADQDLNKENQKRVTQIYKKLADDYLGYSDKLKQWANKNKILSKNGKSFFYPSELSVVTAKGFKGHNLAFCDEKNEKIIELLKIFGVLVIDKIILDISGQAERQDLKKQLIHILPLLVIVSIETEKSRSKKGWEYEFNRLKNKLSNIVFFEASEIYLSYGNAEDKQKSSSYYEDDNFYYVGKWNKPRVLDSLVETLGKFLGIRDAERHLSVLLSDTFEEGIEYLKEKFGDSVLDIIPDELRNSSELMESDLSPSPSEKQRFSATNHNSDDAVSSPELAEKYGILGEEWASRFYSSQGYKVLKSPESSYDLVCQKASESLKVEVKAITFNRPNIRLTEREWEQMAKDKDIYELFIFSHDEENLQELIRVRRAGYTLQDVLSKLPKTTSRYSSDEIEFLIGLQLNQSERGNDVMISWHRLLKNLTHDAIEKYQYDNATSTFYRL